MDAVLSHADHGQIEPLTTSPSQGQRAGFPERWGGDRATTMLSLVVVVPAIRGTDGHVGGPSGTV